MKVIGIVGSPRKNGNVDTLVQTVLAGAAEAGNETSIYELNEMEYSGCQACGYCKSHDECKLDDEVSELMNDIESADAVVIGTPVYFHQPTGQFRLMEDRLYMFLGSDFKVRLKPGKKAIIITSQGSPDIDAFKAVDQGIADILRLYGFNIVDTIRMTNGSSPSAVRSREDLMERAKADGKAL